LPGPELHDLLDWRHVLGQRTGVESLGRTARERESAYETIGRMNTNALGHGIASNFQILRGDLENVIINAVDADGNRPICNDGQPIHLAHFLYDVYNLDFNGGLGYRSAAGTKRVEALKKLFERQQGHDFVLFLTVNLRDTLGDEYDEYLRGLQGRNRSGNCRETLEWYLQRGQGEREYKLKVAVPALIQIVAELRLFSAICHPPVFYKGYNRADLLHFAFEMRAESGSLRGWSTQDDAALIELPLFRSENEGLILAPMHPGFDMTRCEEFIRFLPDGTRAAILAVLPTSKTKVSE